jgi:hypothetical protein
MFVGSIRFFRVHPWLLLLVPFWPAEMRAAAQRA